MPRFAALGHQESWRQIAAIVSAMRPAGAAPVKIDDIRSVIPWIPPRTVSRFSVAASDSAPRLGGVFIDTFISPDELAGRPARRVLDKIQDAIAAADREGVAVATLGGFTSIMLESVALAPSSRVALTTGNSLTAALILLGMERATSLLGRDLADEEVLVIGATGDVGSACARVLSGRVRNLFLCARNGDRLEREAKALASSGPVEFSTCLEPLLAKASLVVAAASTPRPTFGIHACREDAIICDAGYPKNVAGAVGPAGPRLFWGGMGVIAGGLRSSDGILEQFYRFPVPDVAHGCMLEGAALALAGRFESYSSGRGGITPARVEEIWRLAKGQGVRLAPLFNDQGLWPEEAIAQTALEAQVPPHWRPVPGGIRPITQVPG